MKSLRKGYGYHYAARVSAHILQKLMRYANIKTTMDYYANVDVAVEEAVFSRSKCNDVCNKSVSQPQHHGGSSGLTDDQKKD
jgi:hypothetical protein